MNYRDWSLDENHQTLLAIHDDHGFVVKFANILYRIHNGILAFLIRNSRAESQ